MTSLSVLHSYQKFDISQLSSNKRLTTSVACQVRTLLSDDHQPKYLNLNGFENLCLGDIAKLVEVLNYEPQIARNPSVSYPSVIIDLSPLKIPAWLKFIHELPFSRRSQPHHCSETNRIVGLLIERLRPILRSIPAFLILDDQRPLLLCPFRPVRVNWLRAPADVWQLIIKRLPLSGRLRMRQVAKRFLAIQGRFFTQKEMTCLATAILRHAAMPSPALQTLVREASSLDLHSLRITREVSLRIRTLFPHVHHLNLQGLELQERHLPLIAAYPLQTLNVSYCQVKMALHIFGCTLAKKEKLLELDLSAVQFQDSSTVPLTNLFEQLPGTLRTLHLRNCGIRHLDLRTFTKLEELDLSGNGELVGISTYMLPEQLLRLRLAGCKITSLALYYLATRLPLLQNLDISNMRAAPLMRWKYLAHFVSLLKLKASGCRLQNDSIRHIARVKTLGQLDISNNPELTGENLELLPANLSLVADYEISLIHKLSYLRLIP